MWNAIYAMTRSRLVWLFAQLLILCVCITYIHHVYVTNILPDRMVGDVFKQTQCFIISKRLSSKGYLVHRYRADFLASYHTNDVQYNRWISGNGLDRGFTKNVAEQEDILSQFEVGGRYACWFNPEMPTQVMLLPRRQWQSAYPVIIPILICFIVLYFFIKTLFYCVDQAMIRSRKARMTE